MYIFKHKANVFTKNNYKLMQSHVKKLTGEKVGASTMVTGRHFQPLSRVIGVTLGLNECYKAAVVR